VRQNGDTLEADITNIAELDQNRIGDAELNYVTSAPKARNGRFYEKDQWERIPAERADGLLRATVPPGTRACFINLFWDGLPVSSRFLQFDGQP
jgi:hypothetical protein